MSGLIVETGLSSGHADDQEFVHEERDEWMPVDVTPRSAKCSLSDVKHEIGVIKANVQFLLDRVLVLEGLVAQLVKTTDRQK
jgi:hypothetical protein